MRTSTSATSGCCSRAAWIACTASATVPASSKAGSEATTLARIARMPSSSSAIRTRMRASVSTISDTSRVASKKDGVQKARGALPATADPAALEVRAVEMPADAAGGAHLGGLEERRLDRLDPLLVELREARDHARDAGARDGSLDCGIGRSHQEEKSAVAMTAPRLPLKLPVAMPRPTR